VDTGGLVMKAKVHPRLTLLIEKEPGWCWSELVNLSPTYTTCRRMLDTEEQT
jgi:hypothetical protein